MQAAFGWEMAWPATVRGRAPPERSPGSDAGDGTNGQLDPARRRAGRHAGRVVGDLVKVRPWASTRIVPSAVGWALTVAPVSLGVGAPVQPEGATAVCRTVDSSACTPAAEGHS